jgi:threonylcarbamoyladenosine tRNA methylthiotransferase MtaB
MPDKTCRFVTLGCKVNQYDTQLVREAMFESGYRECGRDERADVCVVNTCTVTENADRDGRYEIRRLLRQNPGTRIVVMGCYAARAPEELRSLPGVSLVVADPSRLGESLREIGVARLPRGVSRFAGHHRAFVKVQDGCVLDCTFCIIPQVRPKLASRLPDEIEVEVRRLIGVGFHEVVLTGIHLGHYGLEWSRGRARRDWCRLSKLVRRLTAIPGDWRLRLSSLEATEVNDELIDVMAGEPRVCPHLHLCLQSGSDAVLAAMRRRYRAAGFMRRVEAIRGRLKNVALTTDVIVGFPGETDADFEATLQVCEAAGFSKIHIFPYSARRGTPAAEMSARVDASVLSDRKCRLQALESRLAERYYHSLVGHELEVLVERVPPGGVGTGRGTACRYAPVEFPAVAGDEFQLVRMVAADATPNYVVGRRIGQDAVWSSSRSGQWPVLNVVDHSHAKEGAKGAYDV